MKSAGFNGCVRYVMAKQDARLLAADGVLLNNIDSVISSFEVQRMMRPNIKHPVGHISLSFHKEDESRLTNGAMVKLAKEYMEEMGIKDTQYIVVRHYDNGNPHMHIVYNRIDNNGKTISDKNDRYRNEAVCKKLKDKYDLTYGKGKEKVKQQRLRGKDKVKYEIFSAIKEALPRSTDWKEFEARLKNKGIAVSYKYKGQTNEVQGVSFIKDNITFKGSQIDRGFSYSKLNTILSQNSQIVSNTKEKEMPEFNQTAKVNNNDSPSLISSREQVIILITVRIMKKGNLSGVCRMNNRRSIIKTNVKKEGADNYEK